MSIYASAASNEGQASFVISGLAEPGQLLQVHQGSNDPEGNGDVEYQWQVSANGFNWNDVGSGSSYVLTEADADRSIRVVAKYVDGDGFSESVTTEVITVCESENEVRASLVISGQAEPGQVLQILQQTSYPDSYGDIAYYQWQTSADGSNWSDVGSGRSYALTDADAQQSIRVVAGYVNADGLTEYVASNLSTVTAPNLNSATAVNQGQASFEISGLAEAGQVLQVHQQSSDSDSNAATAYLMWQRSADGSDWSNVGSGPSFQLTELDTEQSIRVVAGYVDVDGLTESVVSEVITVAAPNLDSVTAVNEGQASFQISGIAEAGQVLQVHQRSNDPDGNGNTSASYQWQRSADGSDWSDVGNGPSYALTELDAEQSIRVVADYVDGD